MLLVEKHDLDTVDDVRNALQRAIVLEHATIPPYLTAWFSVKRGSPTFAAVAPLFAKIFVDEMKHLGTVANILNAIGGTPGLNAPGFIPAYPGGLPFHIGDRGAATPFAVGLRPLTRELVHDTFMVIEEPAAPLDFPVKERLLQDDAAFPDRFQTIGEFYGALSEALDASYFVADASKQVTSYGLPLITGPSPSASLDNARKAIDTIRSQGEGTAQSPLQGGTTAPAHYYTFAEIDNGKALVADTSVPQGYSYSGKPVAIDPQDVYGLLPDPTADAYDPASPAGTANRRFNSYYSNLLDGLQAAFNGDPQAIFGALQLMAALTTIAAGLDHAGVPNGMVILTVTGKDGTTYNASPTYTYVAPPDRIR